MAAINTPQDDSSERFSLLEMDHPAKVQTPRISAPVAAPAITVAPVAAPSPLVAGRALLAAATDAHALLQAAHAATKVCTDAGITDKAHPTREALRALYFSTLAWFCLLTNMVGLRKGLTERPALVRPLARPIETPAETGLDLSTTLGGIASESTTNAAGQVSGSLASGTMRGVGFSTAAGYVTALANGVKRSTADIYLSTLRGAYNYTEEQIAALTVSIIAESTLPVGAGITHTPAGPDIFTQRREAAAAAARVIRETADATTLALAQRLTVADSPEAWWEIGWMGHGSITRAELIAACGVAPSPKINSTQLSRTIDSLRGTHDASMVDGRPAGVKVRWQIGRGKQHAAFVGAEYGRVLAIVDLNTDNTLTFDGDQTIADEVRAEYSRLCGDEVLRPGDVTSWLQQLLRREFSAVRSGERFLVSPQYKSVARALCSAISNVWSVGNWVRGRLDDNGVPELGVTYQDVATVIGGIWQGLASEVTAAEERWSKTVADAATKAAKPGVRACTNEMERIDGTRPDDGLVARVNGLRIIGEGPLGVLRARVTALRAQVAAALLEANDPTSERFANLELT